MNITIYSKDRACQLEWLIRTMKENFVEFSSQHINVILKYSNDIHRKAYEILFTEHPQVNYIVQNNQSLSFKELTLNAIDKNKKFTVFFVDDIVFKNRFSIHDTQFSMMDNKENFCVSLRMNKGMNYCQTGKFTYSYVPDVVDNRWKWKNQQGDWGYPLSLDGHVFRTEEILPILLATSFDNPTYMESNMSGTPLPHDYCICYDNSILVNNPMNRVHNFNNNPCSNISTEWLSAMFIVGNRLFSKVDLRSLNNNAPHFQFDIEFRKKI